MDDDSLENQRKAINETYLDKTQSDPQEQIIENSSHHLRGRYAKITQETRLRIITQFQNGNDAKFISNYESVPISTVRNILNIFKNTGRMCIIRKGGCKNKKLMDDQKNFIMELVNDDCTITLREIQNKIFNKYSINVAQSTIHYCLKSMHYSLKTISLIPTRRNDEQSITTRMNYASRFMEIEENYNSRDIFYLDEVGFNVSLRCKRGRSKKGVPAIVSVPGIRSKNISVCCVMTRSGIKFWKVNHNPYNTESFLGYIDEFADEIIKDDIRNSIIIMDNVPFHKSNRIRNLAMERNINIEFLPPYSPFLNPIENLFSKWKAYVRRSNPMCENDLMRSMENGLRTLTENDCEGYYLNMKKYIRLSIQGMGIFE